jgi:uncharacterized Zn-binding protein involved in type VI secretion
MRRVGGSTYVLGLLKNRTSLAFFTLNEYYTSHNHRRGDRQDQAEVEGSRMPFPASRLTDVTVTGDVITAPGAPTVLIMGLPASCLGDAVAGSVCVGVVVVGSPTVLITGRPATRITSSVAGANPVTGITVTTAVATGAPTVLVP